MDPNTVRGTQRKRTQGRKMKIEREAYWKLLTCKAQGPGLYFFFLLFSFFFFFSLSKTALLHLPSQGKKKTEKNIYLWKVQKELPPAFRSPITACKITWISVIISKNEENMMLRLSNWYLLALWNETNDWKWNFNRPSTSCALAPCFASIPLPRRSTIIIDGLPTEARDGGISWISSMSSQRKKNLVLCPNKFAWNPIILADKKRRPCIEAVGGPWKEIWSMQGNMY